MILNTIWKKEIITSEILPGYQDSYCFSLQILSEIFGKKTKFLVTHRIICTFLVVCIAKGATLTVLHKF